MNKQVKIQTIFTLFKKKEFVEAEQLLLHYLSDTPHDTYLKALLANTYLKQKRISEAIELADEVLSVSNNAEALAVKGLALSEINKTAEGIELLELSLAQRENFFYRSQLVQLLFTSKQLAEIEKHLRILLDKDPENSFYRKLQSKFLAVTGKQKEALEVLRSPSQKIPQDPFDYVQYLRLKIKSKSHEKALSELTTLATLPAHRENPHLKTLIGEIQMKLQLFEDAEASFSRALYLLPENKYIQQHLGFLYSKMKRYDKVIDVLTPLFLHQPTHVYVRRTLLSAYEKSNRVPELVNVLEQALVRHPEVKQLHGLLKKTRAKIAE